MPCPLCSLEYKSAEILAPWAVARFDCLFAEQYPVTDFEAENNNEAKHFTES